MYGAYELEDDAAVFGFSSQTIETSLGPVRAAVAPHHIESATVFLHGVGLTMSSWTPVIRAAEAAGRQTAGWVLIDLPGFGGSGTLKRGTSIEQVSSALQEVIRQVGFTSFNLVGHSMGGFLALDMAGRNPPGLKAVLSLSGAYGGIVQAVNSPLRTLVARPATCTMYQLLRLASATTPLTRVLPTRLIPLELVALAISPVAAHPGRLPKSFLRALVTGIRGNSFRVAASTGRGYDVHDRWRAIDVPLMATYGTRDALVTSRDTDFLSAAVPAARVIRMEETGHFAPVERPGLVSDLVQELIALGREDVNE